MAESLKEKLCEKAVDVVFDLFTNLSYDELKEFLDKDRHQKILYKVICNFQKSSYFHREFHSVIYVDNRDVVFSIANDDISPAKTVEQIQEAIVNVINECFITDSQDSLSLICRYVASVYLQRTKMMIQIYDVLPQMRESFDRLDEGLDDLKQLIKDNRQKEMELRREREFILKKELHNEVSIAVSDIMNRYLYLLLKSAPEFKGIIANDMSGAMAGKIRELINAIDEYVKDDFIRVPVILTVARGLDTHNETIPFLKYSEHCFRKVILERTAHLMQYHEIVDSESYLSILRLRNSVQGNFFLPLDEMGQSAYINADAINLDVKWAQGVLYEVGENILTIYNNLVR